MTGVFSASSPPRKPPNILVSPIVCQRLLEWRFAGLPRPAEVFDSCDTPRRMAPFRRPGCLEPLLGHDVEGIAPRRIAPLWACALPRPTNLWATPPSDEDIADEEVDARFEGLTFRPSLGRGERRRGPLVTCYRLDFRLGQQLTRTSGTVTTNSSSRSDVPRTS